MSDGGGDLVVYKYPLMLPIGPPGTLSTIELPKDSMILRVGAQGHRFSLWALIHKSAEETEQRKWLVVGTGHEFNEEALKDIGIPHVPYEHMETVIALGGSLVLHFWFGFPGQPGQ